MNSKRPHPNILVLMTDQQRWDSLGVYGCDFAHTPNLDRLGREGAVFDNCTVNNPICTPSRASMLTGKHLPGHGVYRLYDLLPEDEVLFPERLQELGYTTALFGKLHVSAVDYEHYQRHPHDGFDVFEPCMEGCLRMDAPYQAYAQWLRENHPDEPFPRALRPSGVGEGELYDMADDPGEQHNRWEDPAFAAIKAALLDKLRQWLRDHETQPGSRGGECLARVQMQNAGK